MIENIEKKDHSSFFPKDWTPEHVEKAILEAYANRQQIVPGRVEGYSSEGIKILIWIDAKGQITTAYPLYGKGR